MRLKVGAATSTGRVRASNQDAFLADAGHGLFLVCDGMGGAASGEIASRMAVDAIVAALNGGSALEPVSAYLPQTMQLGRAIKKANRTIYDRAQAEGAHAGMGTTVVGALVGEGIVSVAHVGDSRAYVRNRSGFEGVTSDHSFVEAQVRAGILDRAESLKSEHQNILLRALGREPSVDVELTEVPMAVGDSLLLCTDGLTRMVGDEELAATVDRFHGEPQRACDHLIEMANAKGGPDNITVIVVELQGSRLSEVFGRFTRLNEDAWPS